MEEFESWAPQWIVESLDVEVIHFKQEKAKAITMDLMLHHEAVLPV